VDQLRRGARLQDPAAELGVHSRRQRGPLPGLVGGAERLRRVDPGHRVPAPAVRRRPVLHPRPGGAAAQRAGDPARVRAAANAWSARRALQGGQAAALHRGGLRPGGLGTQDLLRWGHPAAGGAAAGQPQRGPWHRQGRVGEVLQQRQHRRDLFR
jgi:hypothetical protein